MSFSSLWELARPRYERPPLPPLGFSDTIALIAGTGGGSGFMRPFSATWGSLLGFLCYGLLLWRGTVAGAIICSLLGLWLGVWSAGRCERIFGRKDPKPVVIDEIACVPIALWPLALLERCPWWLWITCFCVYRLFDIWKPYPARLLERVPGGFGVLLDDAVAALYMGGTLYGALHIFSSRFAA